MNALPRLQPGCSRAATLPMQAVRRALPSRPARASSVQAAGAADLPPPGPVAAALKAVQLRQPGSPRGKHEDVWSLEDAAEMGATCSNSEKELGRRCGRAVGRTCVHVGTCAAAAVACGAWERLPSPGMLV